MNILLTGGTGFIGSHLLKELVRQKHKVVLVKRSNSNTWRIESMLPFIKTYDWNKLVDHKEIFLRQKIDLIIHLATKYIKHYMSCSDIVEMNNTNITFPTILVDLAVRHKIKSFINTGTCFEYRPSTKKISEKNPAEAFNYYASTKQAFEKILQYYQHTNDLKCVTLKLFYPYGEKDNNKVIPQVIRSFLSDSSLSLTQGTQKINFTYVQDIVDAYMKTIEYLNSVSMPIYETFNIGSGKTYTIIEVIKMLTQISRKSGNIQLGAIPTPSNEIMYMNCNFTKANRILGWKPQIDLYTGLRHTYNYYLEDRRKVL